MPKKPMTPELRYEATVQEDGDDLLIPIPPDMLANLGWSEHDEVEITVDQFQRYIVRRKS